MINRREFVRSTVIGLTSLACLPKITTADEKVVGGFADLVKSKLDNGIDRIFKVVDIKDIKTSVPIPVFSFKELDQINDFAWQTLIAASIDNKDHKFPAIQFQDFADLKATDLFADSIVYQYIKYREESAHTERKCKIHSINLKQYYNFYTNQLKQKFMVYRSSLVIAANLSEDSAQIIVKDNYFGIYVKDNSNFILGQI